MKARTQHLRCLPAPIGELHTTADPLHLPKPHKSSARQQAKGRTCTGTAPRITVCCSSGVHTQAYQQHSSSATELPADRHNTPATTAWPPLPSLCSALVSSGVCCQPLFLLPFQSTDTHSAAGRPPAQSTDTHSAAGCPAGPCWLHAATCSTQTSLMASPTMACLATTETA